MSGEASARWKGSGHMFTFKSATIGTSGYVSSMERESVNPTESGIRRIQHRLPHTSTSTAFVFSGGGAKGALHVGALRALLEAGIRPDMVVGTSIGAWNAAWTARTPTLDGVEELANVWRGLQPQQVLLGPTPPLGSRLARIRALNGLLMLAALRRVAGGCSSLYSDAGLREMLTRHLAGTTFDELALPCSVIAMDLSHGGRAIFRRGPVVDALLASSAIPGIFPPVCIDGAMYADGGMVDGCSVETAVEMGARRIFVLAIGYDADGDGGSFWSGVGEHQGQPAQSPSRRSVATVIQRASQVMGNYQIQRAVERVPSGVEVHLISLSTGTGRGTLSFGNVSRWIESAYSSTRAYLDAENAHNTLDTRECLESAACVLSA